ncbi:MAG: NUDIX hydrolase [Tenericutes bacterium]|nr:NUDIX hydrolase [Mycoplasmatota bacterium]
MEKYEVLSENCKIRWIDKFKLNGEKYTQVSGYIYNEKNQLLIVKNGDNWTIPGGHPEPGETQLQTLERELMEEACVTLKDIIYLGAVEVVENGETYYQLRYTAKVLEVLPFDTECEVDEREFVRLENLPNYIKWSKGITFSEQIEASKKVWNI